MTFLEGVQGFFVEEPIRFSSSRSGDLSEIGDLLPGGTEKFLLTDSSDNAGVFDKKGIVVVKR